ncbi:MAG: hypothetical protein U0103_16680 [Candidatus Obscuribacterales bacterium]
MNRLKKFFLASVSFGSFALASERAVALHHSSNLTEAGVDYAGLIVMLICGVIVGWAYLYEQCKD